jgi:hypothetical protein
VGAAAGAAAAGSLGSGTGGSLGGLGGTGTSAAATNGSAVLVAVQGNSYATVAVFDFGSQVADDEDVGRRMPWLSQRYPLGDTSPLTRFVIGQTEAVQQYLGGKDTRLGENNEKPAGDPWDEDLFQRRPPVLPPGQQDDERKDEGDAEAMLPGQERQPLAARAAAAGFWESCGEDPELLTPEVEALAVLLAGGLLARTALGLVPGERGPERD